MERYPHLKETPDRHPLQRTEWNVRDGDAILILIDGADLSVSIGTQRAHKWAGQHGKPHLVVDVNDRDAAKHAKAWLHAQKKRFGPHMVLSIGGPRETEAPGIYKRATAVLTALL